MVYISILQLNLISTLIPIPISATPPGFQEYNCEIIGMKASHHFNQYDTGTKLHRMKCASTTNAHVTQLTGPESGETFGTSANP